MKWVWAYLKPLRKRLALGISIKTIATLAELLIPMILTYILDNVIGNATGTDSVGSILLFGAVCAVIGAPVWVGGVLWFVFGFKWALAMAIGCLAFWWLPGTPFMVLSLTVTLAIKRWGKRVLKKGKSAVKKHNKYVKQKIRERKKYKHSKKKDNAENTSSENSSNQVNEEMTKAEIFSAFLL